MDYQKGKIYKIESHLGPKIYIGSTTKDYLSQRMTTHRHTYNYWKTGKGPKTSSYDLFDEYGIENCQIVLLESCPCENKDQLNAKESHYIKTLECVNRVVLGRTKQEYNTENKLQIKEHKKQYYEENKDKIRARDKQYYEKNKQIILEKGKAPFTCECGSKIQHTEKARHERTKKHLNYLASKTE